MSNSAYLYRDVIEFEDVDSYGIAHHSKLICILERARVHFFKEKGVDLHGGELQLVLANMDIKFLAPAKMMDEVSVDLRVEKLGAAALVWNYQMSVENTHVLKAKIKMASVDARVRPKRFPGKVRDILGELVMDEVTG
jgi:YbgC/YbaW family acyl-CoA thioester hydrolase